MQAHIPKLVEGDFTFVTIIHLIGFQLNQRGCRGLYLCLFSSFLLLHIKEHASRVTKGLSLLISSETIPPSVEALQGCPRSVPSVLLHFSGPRI